MHLEINEAQYFKVVDNIVNCQEFNSLFTQLRNGQTRFRDPAFPPDLSSLAEKNTSSKLDLWSKLVWLRPEQFLGKDYKIFDKNMSAMQSRIGLGQYISPRDIQQGQLGDCYFLSSITSLAD